MLRKYTAWTPKTSSAHIGLIPTQFAPRSSQRFLSYVAGWLSVLCWQAGNASGFFLAGYMAQFLVILHSPSYTAPVWEGFLLVIAVVLLCTAVNIWGERFLPVMQNVAMGLHAAAFAATGGLFWALGPRIGARTAVVEFTNQGGWGSMGLALMVGQIGAVVALGGQFPVLLLQRQSLAVR